MQMFPYFVQPSGTVQADNHLIGTFSNNNNDSRNIDEAVVESFGEEWETFNDFSDTEIKKMGNEYFDIVTDHILHQDSIVLDVGCGTGRWSKYLLDHFKVKHIDAIDPSDAIFVASRLLRNYSNVRLSKCDVENLPFADNTFDFVMSVGVLHHLPDTAKAISSCVRKIKPGGHFYVYLYYDLDNKGIAFKTLLRLVSSLRRFTSKMPSFAKKLMCEIIAALIYAPIVYTGKLLKIIGLDNIAQKLPLSFYQDKSFYIIRNDALDRFGTKIEHRFSRKQVEDMLVKAGLNKIKFSDKAPYWHVIAQKPHTE